MGAHALKNKQSYMLSITIQERGNSMLKRRKCHVNSAQNWVLTSINKSCQQQHAKQQNIAN